MNEDFTIIIQGPTHNHSINNIDNYKKFGHVIVSCYKTDQIDFDDSIDIVRSDPVNNALFNGMNLAAQSMTTLNGLLNTKTPYAIKVRSDEYYTDLTEVIATVRKYPNKYISNNVFFKRADREPFYPSDHVIGGSTNILKDTFLSVLELCAQHGPSTEGMMVGSDFGAPWLGHCSPETIIFCNYLKIIGALPSSDTKMSAQDFARITREHADVVPISKMGDTCITVNSPDKRLFFYNEIIEDKYSPSINNLDELLG